jgi:hypothetical protein
MKIMFLKEEDHGKKIVALGATESQALMKVNLQIM